MRIVRGVSRRAAAWLALRALVGVLLAPLACASMLPALSRLAGGPPTHVCHCSAGGAHSTCPVCNPRVGHLPTDERSITGRCGDDELPASGALPFVVAAAPAPVLVASSETVFGVPATLPPPPHVASSPPLPPPRVA